MEEQGQLLSSWKEISTYLGRTIRTCQRLEAAMGLPVHRLDGSPKAHVFAYKKELDAWLAQKVGERTRIRKRRLALYGLGGLAAVIVSAALLIGFLGPKKAPPAAVSPPPGISIAVLPFENLSPDERGQTLGDGIAEAVAGALQKVSGVNVIGRRSAYSLRGQKADERKIGQMLHARYVLEATYQILGDRLRMNASLVSTENGLTSWSEKYDKKMDDLFEVQDEIAISVAENLKVKLGAGGATALRERPTADAEAYLLYLEGRGLLLRPSPDSPGKALARFEQALRRDPSFAPAYAGIALVHANLVSLFVATPNDGYPKAKAALEKALALAPDLPEANALKAWVQFIFEWNWDAAGKSFQRALELDPGDALTRGMHAMFLLSQERFKEAGSEIERALAAEPLSPMLYNYSLWIYATSGQPQEALKKVRQILLIEPDFEFAYSGAALAYLRLGRYAEAVDMLEKGIKIRHIPGRPESAQVVGYMKLGEREKARTAYDTLLKARESGSAIVSAVLLGWAAASLGDMDQAFAWLDTAYAERDPHLPLIGVYAKSFAPELARDPRFASFLDRLGLGPQIRAR
jgi:TolB-like protein/Tfp pilus assembly protein PilF